MKNQTTISALITKLLIEALDRREDMILSAIAKSRDTQHAKMVDHENAWN